MTSSLPCVTLKRNRQSRSFRDGNQLVFTKAIDSLSSKNIQVGQLVQVAVPREQSSSLEVLGYGVYNPHSLYRIRFLCHKYVQPSLFKQIQNKEADPEEALRVVLRHHLRSALQLRQGGLIDWNSTDTYRLCHGEGDSLSGLAIDVIGSQHAVIMSSALWCQVHRDMIQSEVQATLGSGVQLVWRTTPSRLEQDGLSEATKEGQDTTNRFTLLLNGAQESSSEKDKVVYYRENGVKFAAYPYEGGQKTSVYCDQRENRMHVASLAKGKTVLDLCCYHGGFSLTALVQGNAKAATAVDSSADAVKAAADNAELNRVELECVQADITSFLQDMHGQRSWDIVVLDPPKLAPSVSALDKARRKYHALNRDAIKVIADTGGYLMTCTCSAAMTQEEGGQAFLNMVQGAALAAHRRVTLLRVSGAASCHTQSPISWPAGNYLTAALFYVHPTE
ncbi:hypothetical protein FisN_5Lh033 [Fistulifera solaris]|uniref:Uncharacterized protein n=1 Tax=Fistulifera solaris TaxID=1519565 RepID=A0A1Z5JJ61_FISSO|nr:hypothetical protein FisN_5Lh033 [Fistulifera solaris]|eukprot:GAX14043.1 hypothetical protein FisN_5Lh033 [Fistulifera solaris]